VTRWRAAAVALLAGAATVGAFAPLGLYPLALLGFAALIHLWLEAPRPADAFRIGFWFGLGLFGCGVSWVYVSLHRFGAMPAPLAAIATLAFCAILALYPALAGWLQARVRLPGAIRAVFVIPALWTFFEWLRGWLFTGFPWLSAGYSGVDTPLAGLAPLGGVYAMSLATLVCAGLLWCVARGRVRWAAAAALAALLAAGAALRHIEWTTPVGAPFRAALLQGDIPQDLKFDPQRYANTLETYARLAEQSKASLIVLPETALPRFLDSVDPAYLQRLGAAARRNGGDLLLGVPYRAAPGKYYNSVLSLGISPPQIYHKVHLVPFGEFVPPGFGWVVRILSIPLADFSRGAPDQPPLAVAGQRVAIDICYEDAYGAAIARALPAATLLVNVSNVAWFGDSLAPAQHLQIARLRALETGRMMLAATNTGITAAIGRDGSVLARLPEFVIGRLEVQAQGYAGATPYSRTGDWPALAAALALLALAYLVARARRSR
jgi:apolipoprotein N-acyltransferase